MPVSCSLKHVLVVAALFLLGCILLGCGADSSLVANQQLSNALAVSNVIKRNVTSSAGDGLLVGQVIDVDLHNTGLVPIHNPFHVTWTLLDPGGGRFAADTLKVEQMATAEQRRLVFTLSFPPVQSLAGYRDGVAFDFVDPP